ncbi:4Fe-4S dicluster domain-containing protein [Amycolatopsis pigmentata]|uniref:4Fe-4S dicluster domain-containing protein n=1 Tax=Amycolatopsis pigmentata TaxID=450801 RepID=A0ABW5G7M9_9PSEU
MIELVSAQRCIACDKCIKVCPTNVFTPGADGIPVISRQDDCQTCFQCEANCPVDALFVAPYTHPLPAGAPEHDADGLLRSGLLGSYREQIGWGRGRTPGAARAIGPALHPDSSPIIS